MDGFSFFYPSEWVGVRVCLRLMPTPSAYATEPRAALSLLGQTSFSATQPKWRRISSWRCAPPHSRPCSCRRPAGDPCPQVTSPSSTKFANLEQYGTLEEVSSKLAAQYLIEFASTRIGCKRDTKVVSAAYRTAADGAAYLDSEINIKSYAVTDQYGVSPAERGPPLLEWDRRLLTTLGVANGRLYSLRLQVPEADVESVRQRYSDIQTSFRVFSSTF